MYGMIMKEIGQMTKPTIGTINGPVHFGKGNQEIESLSYGTNGLAEIQELVTSLLEDNDDQWKAHLESDKQDQIQSQLEELRQELARDKPDESVVTSCLYTIREIAIGAAEPAVYGAIMQTLLALGAASAGS